MAEQTLSALCKIINENGFSAGVEGSDVAVCSVNTLEDAAAGELSFLSNPKYLSAVSTTKATAVIAKAGVELPEGLPAIRCDDPYAAVTAAIITLHGYRKHPQWGKAERAAIDPSAEIGRAPNIAGGVTIAKDAAIGDNCTIYPGCYIGEGARIGDDCVLYPNVVIYDGCILGDRVTIHAGSVVGEDGLGYAPLNGKWLKIPQVGRAVIGDDVEIGANCAIDRATLGQTEIGRGTKFGNAIVIGHGARIGPDCMFVGLIGVAGSTTVGKHVTLAGQVGVTGHLDVGDNVTVGAKSLVVGNVAPDTKVFGSPAIRLDKAKRSAVVYEKLPDWVRRIKDLEREVQQLRQQLNVDAPS